MKDNKYKANPGDQFVEQSRLGDKQISCITETNLQLICSNEENRKMILDILQSQILLPEENQDRNDNEQIIVNPYTQNKIFSTVFNIPGDNKRKKFLLENIKPSDDGKGIEFIKLGKVVSLFHIENPDNIHTFDGSFQDSRNNQMGIPGVTYVKGNREGLEEELKKQNKLLLSDVYPDYYKMDVLLYLPGDERNRKLSNFIKLLFGNNDPVEIFDDETIHQQWYPHGGAWTGHSTGLDDGKSLSLERQGSYDISLAWKRESTHAQPVIVIENIEKDESKAK